MAATGFCMGGALALAAGVDSDEFIGVVPFYGVPDQSKFPAS